MREPAVVPTSHPPTESESLAPAQVSLWSGFSALMRWSLAATGAMLPLIVVVQALLATGIVIGFGFVIPDITPDTALFLASGAPTILLLTIGLVIVPQGVSRARASGALDYQRALPVSRPLLLLVDLVVWTLIALPGVAIGLVVAWLRYDIAFSFDWPLLILASVLVTTMATALGYAIAVTFPAMLAQLLSQVLVFFVLLFSPITFPASQLPAWFTAVHAVLPIQPAADLMRAGIASDVFPTRSGDLLILSLWTILGLVVTYVALARRK